MKKGTQVWGGEDGPLGPGETTWLGPLILVLEIGTRSAQIREPIPSSESHDA